jgi:ATP-dependent Lon protease
MEEKQITFKLPLVITRGEVYFPGNESDDLDVGRSFTRRAIEVAKASVDNLVIVTTQKVYTENKPEFQDVYDIGVVAKLTKIRPRPNYVTVRLEPIARVKITSLEKIEDGYFVAEATTLPSLEVNPNYDAQAAVQKLIELIMVNSEVTGSIIKEIRPFFSNEITLEQVTYFVANQLVNNTEQKQRLLEELDTTKRLETIIAIINEDMQSNNINAINQIIRNQGNVESKASEEASKNPNIKAGDEEEDLDTNEEILKRLEQRFYPENIVRKVKKELRRMSKNDNERARTLEYLDWILNLPYDQETIDNLDLENVAKVLDEDHYGLEEPKKRIVEYIAVKRMSQNLRSPIICFYGPPGTGKTSLAMSIARALGRKLVKSSLGGVDDEAKLRGFLRTYIGSQPGTIISSIRKGGTINPVFVLDEVDKLAQSRQGDPSSALLEILDPKQNKAFIDHYIEEPYDLSKVMFIATANNVRNIPRPLLDRMELIPLKPYTQNEKINIAMRHLVPKQITEHGLDGYDIKFTEDGIIELIDHYTFEAGVRGLDKAVASVLRKVSVEILQDKNPKLTLDAEEVQRHMGEKLMRMTEKETENKVGVVTGLAVIGDIGGDILPLEVTTYKGNGTINVTGNLEPMMKESGQIAMTHVRSFAAQYGINEDVFEKTTINVHFPDAAPKDGNSAGIAMAVGIISVLTGRKVNCDVAMTGEVSLMGKALPIGGVQEKIIGAVRAKIKKVLLPFANKEELDRVPSEIKDKIEIVLIHSVQDAVNHALLPIEVKEASNTEQSAGKVANA